MSPNQQSSSFDSSSVSDTVISFEDGTHKYKVLDLGPISDENLTVDLFDSSLLISYSRVEDDLELSLPEAFVDPTVEVNNGVITISQEV